MKWNTAKKIIKINKNPVENTLQNLLYCLKVEKNLPLVSLVII